MRRFTTGIRLNQLNFVKVIYFGSSFAKIQKNTFTCKFLFKKPAKNGLIGNNKVSPKVTLKPSLYRMQI